MRLPQLVIIGAARSGTSSLWATLRQHPQLYTYPKKEVHFFDRYWRRGVHWYASKFRGAPKDAMLFEATPAYLHVAVAAERAAKTLPDALFVAMLREPVARCVSHYWLHQDKFGTDPEVLLDSKHRCVAPGHYDVHIARWKKLVPLKRLLIFTSEMFFNGGEEAYALHVLHRAGLEGVGRIKPVYYDPLQHRKDRYGKPRVPKHVLSWLRLHYKPHIERLRAMSRNDIFQHWDKPIRR